MLSVRNLASLKLLLSLLLLMAMVGVQTAQAHTNEFQTIAPASVRLAATTFFVTNTNDSGDGSLRQAILNANGNSGTDTIQFNIPGSGVRTISPLSALPTIIEGVVIDGTTQPGASCGAWPPTLLIQLNGSSAGAGVSGITTNGTGTTIRGLVINNFSANGVVLTGGGAHVVTCNFIGTDASGTLDNGNGLNGVYVDSSANNTIGGTIGNLISGNNLHGIYVFGSLISRNQISSNFIGVDVSGTLDLGNSGNGILVDSAFNSDMAINNNTVSGNNSAGIRIQDASQITLQGNRVGTNLSGTADVGNAAAGIAVQGSLNIAIGRSNVISGNDSFGVHVSQSSNVSILGNWIGVAIGGSQALGNTGAGVALDNSSNNFIGSAALNERNYITSNEMGVYIYNGSTGNQVLGNYIGTDVNGTVDLGNRFNGILIDAATGNLIGGSAAGAGNLISGNNSNGVHLNNASGNTIAGNLIGTTASGTTGLANSGNGIFITNASNNTIGGTAGGAGNVIAFNSVKGVFVSSGAGNAILSNAVFSNGSLGIDLGANGVNANDVGDADTGANNLQNFPVLTSANAGAATVSGSLNSSANTTFRIEFFSNTTCDISGHGEGQTLIGSASVTTDGGGNVAFTANVSTFAAGSFITATATDSSNHTSEFSACAPVLNGPPTAQNDTDTTLEDTAVTTNVVANDSDPNNDPLTLTSFSVNSAQGGTVNCTSGGLCTYTPPLNFSGTDTYTYQISDGNGGSAAALVTITVSAVNDNPVANGDTATTPEDTAVTTNVLLNDTDVDSATLSISGFSVNSAQGGTVNCTSAGLCTYTPPLNFNGADTYTYTASDGSGGTASATVTVTVTPVNDAPVANADSATTNENTAVTLNVIANDTDPNNDPLTIATASATSAQGGTVSCAANGQCTYTPPANFSGTDTFTYQITDGALLSNVATVTITVTNVNRAPVANNDSASTPGQAITIAVMANDFDPDSDPISMSTFSAVSARGGIVSCTTDGQCTYTPPANFTGTDTFTYQITDGLLLSNVATVTIVVSPNVSIPAECVGIVFNGAIIEGSNRWDEIYGTEGNDLILGYGSGDYLNGMGGDDCIVGGRGDDELFGGDGNDILIADSGSDLLFGGSGDDKLFGGSDSDVLYGDAGNDHLFAGNGSDAALGGDGDDYVDGGEGHDAPLAGGNGSDVIYDVSGHDELFGDETHYYPDIPAGSPGSDQLYAGDGHDLLYGGGGNDLLDAGAGLDQMFGDAGDDVLIGGGDGDDFIGGSEYDTANDYDFNTDYVCEEVEVGCTPPPPPDSDADGIADEVDLCAGANDHMDVDGDRIPDGCDGVDDRDDDADGVINSNDICAGADDYQNTDGDGVPDGCDSVDDRDDDGDGVINSSDICQGFDDYVDADGDGIPDGCDTPAGNGGITEPTPPAESALPSK
jgi:parallel beta-helix repeat protein